MLGYVRLSGNAHSLIVALPFSHNTPDWRFFHIQFSRITEHVCWPPVVHYNATVRSVREYFRFRETCRLGRESERSMIRGTESTVSTSVPKKGLEYKVEGVIEPQ
jgi:hypothetical protein